MCKVKIWEDLLKAHKSRTGVLGKGQTSSVPSPEHSSCDLHHGDGSDAVLVTTPAAELLTTSLLLHGAVQQPADPPPDRDCTPGLLKCTVHLYPTYQCMRVMLIFLPRDGALPLAQAALAPQGPH